MALSAASVDLLRIDEMEPDEIVLLRLNALAALEAVVHAWLLILER